VEITKDVLQVLGLLNRIQPHRNGWYKVLQLFILLENFQLSRRRKAM